MLQLAWCTVSLLVWQSAITDALTIPGNGVCPLQERRDAAIETIRAMVQSNLQNLVITLNCGPGVWYHVAHLNMSNSSQQCPSAWREYNNITNRVRGCRRPEVSSGSCPATSYPTGRQYTRVCGRVIGYQYGTTNAFGVSAIGQTIDSYYVYGVSVTHGTPRNHIWTFAAGLSEGAHTTQGWDCPCSNVTHLNNNNVPPPSFIGNNYYCESGNPTAMYDFHHFYASDPLWDGQQCEGQCCSNGKSPPWFSVELTNPTTDDIEVRLCIPEGSKDDIIIQLLELYIQ